MQIDKQQPKMQRSLHLISGDQYWCNEVSQRLIEQFPGMRIAILSDKIKNSHKINHFRQLLGQEFDLVIIDCFSGLSPDAIGAVSGTLRGGGALVLLTPHLAEWSTFRDPDYQRHGHDGELPAGYFIQRFIRLVMTCDAVSLHQQVESEHIAICINPAPQTTTTNDQLATIAMIQQVATGHARRPLVIRADRGRGKSASIGLAAAQLLSTGKGKILVTAPAFASVMTLFNHAAEQLPEFEMQQHALRHADGRELVFLPPDEITRQLPSCDLLCVDEAAAIPAPRLQQMLERYNRIIFSTTVHGYEGSGRGFDLRFQDTLDRISPQWKSIRLHTPIRWQEGDRLEQCISKLLLLDTETAIGINQPETHEPHGVRIRELSQAALSSDEPLLRNLFGLLVTAHYQTTPFDLRHLLDGKDVRIWVAFNGSRLIGTLVGIVEGKIAQQLAQQILDGKRRPRNHLTPQTLSQHLGIDDALDAVYLRIMRIAVHDHLRRQHVGRALIEAAANAVHDSTDLLSTSFGATAELLDFWQKAAFVPVRIGVTRDASSGCHSALLLAPLSVRGSSLVQQARSVYNKNLPLLLTSRLKALETAIVWRVYPGSGEALEADCLLRLQRFARNSLSMDAVLADLRQLASFLIDQQATQVAPEDRDLLVCYALQGYSDSEAAERLGLRGKADSSKKLQAAVNAILAHLNESG